jgi:hypothetical protein
MGSNFESVNVFSFFLRIEGLISKGRRNNGTWKAIPLKEFGTGTGMGPKDL